MVQFVVEFEFPQIFSVKFCGQGWDDETTTPTFLLYVRAPRSLLYNQVDPLLLLFKFFV